MSEPKRGASRKSTVVDVSDDHLERIVEARRATGRRARRLDGIVIGTLKGLDGDGRPLVSFPGSGSSDGQVARSVIDARRGDVGREVALMFEDGDPDRPLIVGLIVNPEPVVGEGPIEVQVDDDRLVLSAEREIVLRCGKASITLTRAGKVILRGAYLLSRSSGVNRIKGGSVQIN